MTPIEQLRCTVPELQGMVGRMWHGQFESEVAVVAGDDLAAVARRTAVLAHELALALGTVAGSGVVLTHSTSQTQ